MNSPLFLIFVVFAALASANSIDQATTDYWANALETRFKDLTEYGLRVPEFQAIVDNQTTSVEPVNATGLLDLLHGELYSLLTSKMSAAQRIRDKAIVSLSSGSAKDGTTDDSKYTSFRDCASPEIRKQLDLKYSSKFKTKIDINHACGRLPINANIRRGKVRDAINMIEDLDGTFTNNYNLDPALKWQYWGHQGSGMFQTFPGRQWDRPGTGFLFRNYDPRVRPWFVAAASGPKNVVIVVDNSGSMGDDSRWETAVAAANAVIGTLTRDDFFGLVTFDNSANSLGCGGGDLRRATPENRKDATEALALFGPAGGTNFAAGLTEALDLLKTSSQKSNCENIILFLTDGEAPDPSTVIDSKASSISNLKLFSYSLGSGANTAIPKKLSCKYNGVYFIVNDNNDLLGKMTEYYSFISSPSNPGTWSPVYIDASGLGMMMTAAVAGFVDDKLAGVAGVDVTMDEIDSVVRNFIPPGTEQSQLAFIINGRGNVIVHPLLKPANEYVNNPLLIDISDLETGVDSSADDAFRVNVRNAMIQGATGNYTVNMRRRLPAGDSEYEGLRSVDVLTTFYFTPMSKVSTDTLTDLFLCIAISSSTITSQEEMSNSDPNFIDTPYYHRLDLYNSASQLSAYKPIVNPYYLPSTHSKYPNLWVSTDVRTIKVAPKAFCNAFDYVAFSDTGAKVLSYQTHFSENSTIDPNPGCLNGTGRTFNDRVRTAVRLTGAIQDIWKSSYLNDSSILWMYAVPTDAGSLISIYPGTLFKNPFYDPQSRAFFHRALTYNGSIAFSTPYTDAASGQTVITLSHSISQNSSNPDAESSYVLGLDFTYTNYEALLTLASEKLPGEITATNKCGTGAQGGGKVVCLTMDKAGYLVNHPLFSAIASDEVLENVYIGEYEPDVLNLLKSNSRVQSVTETIYSGTCHYSAGVLLSFDSYLVQQLSPIGLLRNTFSFLTMLISFLATMITEASVFPPVFIPADPMVDCVQTVTKYQVIDNATPFSGNLGGICSTGTMFFSPINNTNLYLIVIDKYSSDGECGEPSDPHVVDEIPRACEAETTYLQIEQQCAANVDPNCHDAGSALSMSFVLMLALIVVYFV